MTVPLPPFPPGQYASTANAGGTMFTATELERFALAERAATIERIKQAFQIRGAGADWLRFGSRPVDWLVFEPNLARDSARPRLYSPCVPVSAVVILL